MSDFKQVGTVEILRPSIYNIDPYASDPATAAVVEPGRYPLYSDGYSHMWLLSGKLDGQFLSRGDGMFVATMGANFMPLDGIEVTFPSRLFGPADWDDLRADPIALDGHPEQRLRIRIEQTKPA